MEEAFEKLKKEGKNDVDNLVKWLQDSKIIDETKAVEEKTRALFNDCTNKQKVEFEKFKCALGKIAEDQKKNVDDLSKTLSDMAPKVLNAAAAAASAFKDTFTKEMGKK